MKYLKIENGKGFYLDSENEFQTIDLIQKEDMLNLLDAVTDKEIEFEMDENSDEILNEAHKIIYNELYKRLNELKEDKDRFLEESESLYKDALQKYKNEE